MNAHSVAVAIAATIAPLAVLFTLFTVAYHLRTRRRDRFISNFDFGNAARLSLRSRRPELGSLQLDLAWAGLREYFRVCLRAPRQRVPMPSQLVDDAWHGLILDTRRYAQFCEQAFGRFLHHLPQQSATVPVPRRRIERHPAWKFGRHFLSEHGGTHLPLLFAVDEIVELADGFRYYAPVPQRLRGKADDSYIGTDYSVCGSSGDSSSADTSSDSGGGHSGCSGSCSGGCSGGGH